MAVEEPVKVPGYDSRAAGYEAHRRVNPAVLKALLDSGIMTPASQVLDVGCGTGNYAAALHRETGCRMSGVEPSSEMLARARNAARWDDLVQASAESLPFPDRSFDVVMSTDVIHHVGDRERYFREAARVLRDGGWLVTVTDSHEVIPLRQPLSNFFPETVPIELRRYPPVPTLLAEMSGAGFTELQVDEVQHPYELTDIAPYRDKAFSSLLLIDNEAFRRGIAKLESALSSGPITCISRYTLIWAAKPHDTATAD